MKALKPVVAAVAMAAMLWAPCADAVTVTLGEKSSFTLGLLTQYQFNLYEHGANNATVYGDRAVGWETGFRRIRIILAGEIYTGLSFFFETDSPNIGVAGNLPVTQSGLASNPVTPIFVQDAMLMYKVADEFGVDLGLMLLPFSRMGVTSAVSLLTMDYHTFFIKHATVKGNLYGGGTEGPVIWRDVGVLFRGGFLKQHIQYRAGIFAGVRSNTVTVGTGTGAATFAVNPQNYPRFSGTLKFNLWDADEGPIVQGIYMGKKKVLTAGVSADYQQKGAWDASRNVNTDSLGIAADIFFDHPFGIDNQHEVIASFNFAAYNQGAGFDADGKRVPVRVALPGGPPGSIALPYRELSTSPADGLPAALVANPNTGYALFFDVAYRYKKLLGYISYEKFISATLVNDYQAVRGGIGWYFAGHRSNLKLELAGVQAQRGTATDLGATSKDFTAWVPTSATTFVQGTAPYTDAQSTPFQFQAKFQAQVFF